MVETAVWPIHFLIFVFTALKGPQFEFLFFFYLKPCPEVNVTVRRIFFFSISLYEISFYTNRTIGYPWWNLISEKLAVQLSKMTLTHFNTYFRWK